ncbi:Protein of unknown function [Cotesia congregata]|uniref:Phorbol-ester/DAG-type domain-containing protein n=1 Tax=Cotesia congregata TaxID=51543 RepID=A0A8J2HHN8_COTCN|nr:Protein of unknown function [Cotesia congregata]
MNCARCKRAVTKSLDCNTCKLVYHPSCAKEIGKSKVKNCCTKSFIALLSPAKSALNLQEIPGRSSIIRPSSLSNLRRHCSSKSSYKSANSSPRTPPVTSIEDSVFVSHTATPSLKMTEVTTKLPDWSKYSSDEKLNLLLDLTYKNRVSVQNMSQTLDSHTVSIQNLSQILDSHNADIKNLVTNVKENIKKINQLSSSLDAVNNSLTEITKSQELAQNEIKKLTNDLNKNAIKCNENAASIKLLKSTIDSIATSTLTQHTSDHKHSSSQLFSTANINSNLKILALNINSYLPHQAEFEALVNDLQPHIITVVEAWLNPGVDISLKDYMIVRRDRGLINQDGRYMRGGGIACFFHAALKTKILFSSESQDINHPEYLIIDVVLPSTVHILLSAIYRRPQGHLLDNFFVQFNKFYSTYNNIVIMGDLNCNLLKSDRPANHLKSFIAESNLHCIPYGATFHTTETHSWLDVIIVDSKDKLGNYSKSLRPFIGGHDYLVCNYKLELTSKYDKTVKFRNFNRCDHIALSTDLTQKLYIAALNLEDLDPNYLVSHLITSTTSALDTHAPFTTRRLTRPSSPWLTKELRTEFHQRDILYKRARRTRDTNLMILYKKMRKDLKNKLNTARDTYFKSLLENPSQNSNIWSNLKRVGFLKSKKSSPLDHLNANELNCYYANILRKHPSCTLDFIKGLPSHTVRKVDSIFNWSNVDIVEVTKNLKLTLQKSKGRSPDDWAKEVGLVINFEKTKVMVLGNSMKLKVLENSGLPQIVIDGKIIPYVSSAKHLGVHLSNNLSWDVHIAQITRKVYATLKNLKHRKSILSSSTRKILITATVIPNIEYCSLVLIDSSKRLDYKLQCLMNNAVRFIFNLKRDEHITPYRCSLNWLTIKSKRSYNLACFFYKLINSGEPKRSDRLATKYNNVIFKIPNFSTNSFENSFTVTAIRLWRDLPADIINALSLETFKIKAFEFLKHLELEKQTC